MINHKKDDNISYINRENMQLTVSALTWMLSVTACCTTLIVMCCKPDYLPQLFTASRRTASPIEPGFLKTVASWCTTSLDGNAEAVSVIWVGNHTSPALPGANRQGMHTRLALAPMICLSRCFFSCLCKVLTERSRPTFSGYYVRFLKLWWFCRVSCIWMTSHLTR